jgi:ribonuclease BN (tRNA processing enzyme)
VKLTVIGASGTFPVLGRPASGYLIEQDSTRIWCEAGPGTFVTLPVDPDLIDAVVISHQHPDHTTDLLTAFHFFRYRPEPRLGIPVYCPQEVRDRLREFVEVSDHTELTRTFDFHTVTGGDEVEVGNVRLSFRWADHSVPTLASRWEANGRVFAYSADTGPAGDWIKVANDADLFLCEASYQGEPGSHPYPHHLTAADAGSLARQQRVKQLMLTHIPPYLDSSRSVAEAEATFDRPVHLAVPGLVKKI